MKRGCLALSCLLSMSAAAGAQDMFAPAGAGYVGGGNVSGGYVSGGNVTGGYAGGGNAGGGYASGGYDAGSYMGPSVGASEPMFRYDEQERWKHGYIQNVPYYEGFHSFRPYNYHHVFSQSQTAAGWGMSAVLPYSQQFWHKYEAQVDLSRGNHTPVTPYEAPIPQYDHHPKPIMPGSTSNLRDSAIPAPNADWQSPVLPVQGYGPGLPAPR